MDVHSTGEQLQNKQILKKIIAASNLKFGGEGILIWDGHADAGICGSCGLCAYAKYG